MSATASNPFSVLQDQYLTFAKQGQEAAATVADAWARSFQQSVIKVPTAAGQAAADKMVDQMYDFARKMIDVQRDLSKQFLRRSLTVAESAAEQATAVATETTEKVTKVARRTVKSA